MIKIYFRLALLTFTSIILTAFVIHSEFHDSNKIIIHKKNQTVGISIVLYRVNKADKIEDLFNLEKQMNKSKSINLYKSTEDLSIIFMNTAEPYSHTKDLPYQMLYGNYVEKQIDERVINGFVSTHQVISICEWIKKNKVESFEGFSRMYDNLSKEAKQALEDIGADDKKGLFEGYVKPLTEFYFAALNDNNSIVICGE